MTTENFKRSIMIIIISVSIIISNIVYAEVDYFRARELYDEAIDHYKKNNYSEAVTKLDEVNKILGARKANRQSLLIYALVDLGNYERAEKEILEYLKLKPNKSREEYDRILKIKQEISLGKTTHEETVGFQNNAPSYTQIGRSKTPPRSTHDGQLKHVDFEWWDKISTIADSPFTSPGIRLFFYKVTNPNNFTIKLNFNPVGGGPGVPCYVYKVIDVKSNVKVYEPNPNQPGNQKLAKIKPMPINEYLNWVPPGKDVSGTYCAGEHPVYFIMGGNAWFEIMLFAQDGKPFDKERKADGSIKYPLEEYRTYYLPSVGLAETKRFELTDPDQEEEDSDTTLEKKEKDDFWSLSKKSSVEKNKKDDFWSLSENSSLEKYVDKNRIKTNEIKTARTTSPSYKNNNAALAGEKKPEKKYTVDFTANGIEWTHMVLDERIYGKYIYHGERDPSVVNYFILEPGGKGHFVFNDGRNDRYVKEFEWGLPLKDGKPFPYKGKISAYPKWHDKEFNFHGFGCLPRINLNYESATVCRWLYKKE